MYMKYRYHMDLIFEFVSMADMVDVGKDLVRWKKKIEQVNAEYWRKWFYYEQPVDIWEKCNGKEPFCALACKLGCRTYFPFRWHNLMSIGLLDSCLNHWNMSGNRLRKYMVSLPKYYFWSNGIAPNSQKLDIAPSGYQSVDRLRKRGKGENKIRNRRLHEEYFVDDD